MIVAQVQFSQMGGVGGKSWDQRSTAFLCDQTARQPANTKRTSFNMCGDCELEVPMATVGFGSLLLLLTSMNNQVSVRKQTQNLRLHGKLFRQSWNKPIITQVMNLSIYGKESSTDWSILTWEFPVYSVDSPVQQTAASQLDPAGRCYSGPVLSDSRTGSR